MTIEQLLTALGRVDRREAEHGQEPHRYRMSAGRGCWPGWRILLTLRNDPAAFDTWWSGHGEACDACRSRRQKVATVQSNASATVQIIRFLFRATWSPALPYAAGTPVALDQPSVELPLVQYHRLRGVSDPAIGTAWCVTWDNEVFIVLVGTPEALAKWQRRARLHDRQGNTLGELSTADASVAGLLAPGGQAARGGVSVLQFQRSATELQGQALGVVDLLDTEIELVPEEEHMTPLQELVSDLAARNRTKRFFDGLPTQVGDDSEALTLSFYLRVLHQQGRITPARQRLLLRLPWLTDDLRALLQTTSENTEE